MMWLITVFCFFVTPSFAADPNVPHPHQGVAKQFKNPKKTTLSSAEEAIISSGKSYKKQVQEGTGGRGIAIMDISASQEVVWKTITNFQKYPNWIDELSECEIYKNSANNLYARFVISAMMIKVEYFIKHDLHKSDGYLTWTLDYSRESDLDDSTGYWLIYPSPADPSKTRVEYSVDVRIKGWIPSFIEDMLADQGLEDATKWVKRESEKG
jgi:ribosome-associated toxin RatA of RatAB toxin-antitoxin module